MPQGNFAKMGKLPGQENHHGKVVARQSTSFKLLRMGSRYAVVLSVVPELHTSNLRVHNVEPHIPSQDRRRFTPSLHQRDPSGLSSHYWYSPCTQKSLVRCNIRIVFTVAPIASYWHSLNLSSVNIFGVYKCRECATPNIPSSGSSSQTLLKRSKKWGIPSWLVINYSHNILVYFYKIHTVDGQIPWFRLKTMVGYLPYRFLCLLSLVI